MLPKLRLPEVTVHLVKESADTPPVVLERVQTKVRQLALPEPSEIRLKDLAAFALGAEVYSDEMIERAFRFKLKRLLPWWMRLLLPFYAALYSAALRRELIFARCLRRLNRDSIPGFTQEELSVGAYALTAYVLEAAEKHQVAVPEAIAFIEEVCEFTRTLDHRELAILEAFPSASNARELPPFLQQQFDAEKLDPEFYFLGETMPVEYGVGRAVEGTLQLRKARREEALRASGAAEAELSLSSLDEVERLLSERGKIVMLRMYRKIAQYRSFALLKIRSFVPDPNGLEIRVRRMRNISELTRIAKREFAALVTAPSLFWAEALRNGYTVRERGTTLITKRLVYLLIDRSVSMLAHGNLFKAGGVLFSRLLYVLSDDAVLVMRTFDGEVQPAQRAEGIGEAQELIAQVRMSSFVGSGGTDLQQALTVGLRDVRRICAESSLERPQMLVVTDGRAPLELQAGDFKGVELHAFVLERSNDILRRLVQESGGVILENL